MIKLEIELSDLDYRALLDTVMPLAGDAISRKNKFLGNLAGSKAANWLASTYVNRSSQESLEGKTVALLNSREDMIKSVIEAKAGEAGVPVKVKAIRAVADTDSDN